MGGISSIARLGVKGLKSILQDSVPEAIQKTPTKLKEYDIDYKFQSPDRYEDGGRNIGKLDTMSTNTKIKAPTLKEAKNILKNSPIYNRDYNKFKNYELDNQVNPRVSFQTIKEDGSIIQETALRKKFRLEEEAKVVPYLEPYKLETFMAGTDTTGKLRNELLNDPKLSDSQKKEILVYIDQFEDGLLTPEELYGKSVIKGKEATPIKNIAPTKDILKNTPDEELSLNEIKKKYKVNQKQKRVPEVQEAAQKLYEGKISKEEYDRSIKKYQPINLITEMPEVPSLNRIEGTLSLDKVKKGIVGKTLNSSDLNGKRVASRLDIPAYEDYDTWVVSLHDGTKTGGQSIGYSQSVVLRNVDFKSSEKGGLNIARGKTSKATIARIHGDYVDVPTTNVYEKIQLELNNPNSEYIQIGMNPFRHSYFYDKKTMEPILAADEILQLGPLVLGKGIRKGKSSEFKFKEGGRIMRDPNKNYNTQRAI